MTIPTWPSGLPQSPQKGFTETGGPLVLRTQTDTGPAKMRRRATGVSTMSLSFFMTTAQVATFENFVNTTLGGVLRFNFMHPRLYTLAEVRIVPQSAALYTLDYIAPGYWNVKLTLEILPS